MDKGAHYQKCDFQVHSPRDIRWTGNKFGVNSDQVALLTDEEQKEILNSRIVSALIAIFGRCHLSVVIIPYS